MRHDLSGAKMCKAQVQERTKRMLQSLLACLMPSYAFSAFRCLQNGSLRFTRSSLRSLSISVPLSGSQQLHELQGKLFTSFTAARRAFAFSRLCLGTILMRSMSWRKKWRHRKRISQHRQRKALAQPPQTRYSKPGARLTGDCINMQQLSTSYRGWF